MSSREACQARVITLERNDHRQVAWFSRTRMSRSGAISSFARREPPRAAGGANWPSRSTEAPREHELELSLQGRPAWNSQLALPALRA